MLKIYIFSVVIKHLQMNQMSTLKVIKNQATELYLSTYFLLKKNTTQSFTLFANHL